MPIGSAFALQEQSGSGLGNAFAGGAAAAEDATTIFTNPAGMSRLTGMQAAVAGSLICLETNSTTMGRYRRLFRRSAETAATPAVVPVFRRCISRYRSTSQWSAGIGVNAPFGLKTEYDSDWIGRFQGVKSKIETINVNPAVSFKVSDMVSIGGGANYQHLKAELTSRINYAGAIAQAGAVGQVPAAALGPIVGAYAGAQSDGKISGNDGSWGWNIGVLVNADPQTRFGASYRSRSNTT